MINNNDCTEDEDDNRRMKTKHQTANIALFNHHHPMYSCVHLTFMRNYSSDLGQSAFIHNVK